MNYFQGKQGKMKEMYQQAVAISEQSVPKTKPAEEIQCTTHARSIKERFERGEPISALDDESNNKPTKETPDEEVIAAGNYNFLLLNCLQYEKLILY